MGIRALAEAAKARAEAATKGPWAADLDVFDPDDPEIVACVTDESISMLVQIGTDIRASEAGWRQAKGAQGLTDAAFIASARADVPALADAVLRLTSAGMRERLLGYLRRYESEGNAQAMTTDLMALLTGQAGGEG